MNKFLLITKVNLLSFFNFGKVTSSKYKTEKRRNFYKILLLLFAFVYLSYYVYMMVDTSMPNFIALNKPTYLLGVLFTYSCLIILVSNVFKVKNILFDFKDYDLLMSLPIKRNIVILSKIVSIYLLNLLYTMIIMIPGYFAYIKYLNLDSSFLYFFLIFIIPIVPLFLSLIIGIILSWLTSNFKNKTIGSYIVNISLIVIVMLISFRTDSASSIEMANSSINSIDKFGNIYPLMIIYLRLISSFNIIDFLLFIGVPAVLMSIFIYIIDIYYSKIRLKLLKTNVKDNYEIKTYHQNSALSSLYKKELKKFVSNSLYVLNTIFGCILIIVFIILIIIFKDNTIAKLLTVPDLGDFLKKYVFIGLSLLCAMSSTTHPSISLEGKSLWILKSIPVHTDTIFLSKILVNLTFLIPTILISGTFFGFYLHLDSISFLLIYLMPLGYAILASVSGLIFNLLSPNFDFDNEIRVIKQSLPAFLSIIGAFLVVIVPISIKEITINYLISITASIYIIDVILAYILHIYGKNKFSKL